LDGGLNTYSYALNNPIFWDDSSGLDVWYENTTSVGGWHKRICVATPPRRPYCVSFGLPTRDTPYQGFSETSSCGNCTPGTGKEGSGIVYEDTIDPSIGVVERVRTTPQEDRKIKQYLKKQVGNTGPYHPIGYSCRDFSKQMFHKIKLKFLYKHHGRSLIRRR